MAPTLVALSDVPVKGGVFNGGFELAPPFVAVQTATNWIDGTAAGSATVSQYGWNVNVVAAAVSVRFDPTVSHSGGVSLKVSTTDATGRVAINIYDSTVGVLLSTLKTLPPIKSSTKYRFSVWIKTNNAAASSVYCQLYNIDAAAGYGTGIATTGISGTTDWTLYTSIFTSDNDASFLSIGLHNLVAGNVSDAWFDDITLEEIVEDTTFTGTIPTPVRPTIVGVTSTDNIDQSLDTGWAAAQHYDLTNAVNEGATHIQTFTPTRNKVTNIAVKVVAKGTGNWVMIVHNAGNVILAAQAIANASLADNTVTTFNVPNLWAAGALHFHLYSSVADGTVLTTTVHDLETVSYIQYFAKPTENVTVVCNGEKISLSTNEDGLLSGAIIDLDKGKYLYNGGTAVTDVAKISDVYSASAGGYAAGLLPQTVNGWYTYVAAGLLEFDATVSSSIYNMVYKINTFLPIKHLKMKVKIYNVASAGDKSFQISSDNINWITLWTLNTASSAYYSNIVETDIVNGLSTFYIRAYKGAINDYLTFGIHYIEADLDTSTVPSILLQPLATQPQFSENVTLPSVASRIYLRMAKYQNKNGAVVPYLEFTDASAVAIKAIPCSMDNSGEASPCIDIIIAETTNGQQVGTGSNDGATGYILNDGEYMTFSSTTATPKVTYKMGTGTVAIANITMNRLFLSSNGVANSATKDPSHQFNFYLGMLKHGIQKVVERLQGIVNDIQRAIHRDYGEIIITGKVIYSLTTSLALITFGASGNLELNLPDVGIYEVTASILDDVSGITASAAANYSLYQPYIEGVAMTNGEQMGVRIPILAAATVGIDATTLSLTWIIPSYRPGTRVSIYGKKNSATTGTWDVVSDSLGRTKLSYKRIAL